MRHTSIVAPVAVLLLASISCGEPPPPPKAPDPAPVAPIAPQGATAPAPPARRGPSKEMLAHFPVADPTTIFYADLEKLFASSFVRGVAPDLLAMAKNIPPASRACVEAMLASAKEMMMGATSGEHIFVIRVEGTSMEKTCPTTDDTLKPAKIPNATTAYMDDNKLRVLAYQPGWVVLGSPELAQRALQAKGTGKADVSLGKDEVIAFRGGDQGLSGRVTVALTDDLATLSGDADFAEGELAESFGKTLSGIQASGGAFADEIKTDAAGRALLERILKSATIKRDGKKLSAKIELRDAKKEYKLLASVGAAALDRRLLTVKQDEARYTLDIIERRLNSWWERTDIPQPKKRFTSFPAVPATIPKGTRVELKEADWKAWAPLKFEWGTAVSYQFEIKAAKDGLSCDVIARGDLNGNGKASSFTLHAEIDPKKNVLKTEKIKEVDPDE